MRSKSDVPMRTGAGPVGTGDNDGSSHGMAHDDHGEWFRHEPEQEGMPQAEHAARVSSTALGVTFLAIAFGVLFVILLLVTYFNRYTGDLKTSQQEGTQLAAEQMSYRAAERAKLNSDPAWINRETGTVRIPIDDAIDRTIDYYSQPGRQAAAEWNRPATASATTGGSASSAPAASSAPTAQQEATAVAEGGN